MGISLFPVKGSEGKQRTLGVGHCPPVYLPYRYVHCEEGHQKIG